MWNPDIKRYSINAALIAVSLTVSLLVSEFVVRRALFTEYERQHGARPLFDSLRGPFLNQPSECGWNDTLTSHPYLGWVYRKSGECVVRHENNNMGMLDAKDIPPVRDVEYFSILIVGGSVAHLFSIGPPNEPGYLEKLLNEKFISPNGKPFRVFNGAFGGWKFPQQNAAAVLWGPSMDAIVALDGHNESLTDPMDNPDVMLVRGLSREAHDLTNLINLRMIRQWRFFCLDNGVFSQSFAAVAMLRWGVSHVQESIAESDRYGPIPMRKWPEDISPQHRIAWNKERFKNYVRLLAGEAQTMGLKFAHFLQPIPTYRKPLSDEENRHKHYVFPERYTSYEEAADELYKEGLASYSLTGIFENVTKTIYSDEVHCAYDENGVSLGYRMMAAQIGKTLAVRWKLRPKQVK